LQGRPFATAGTVMEGFWTLEQWRRVGSCAAAKKIGDWVQQFPPLFTFLAGGEEFYHL